MYIHASEFQSELCKLIIAISIDSYLIHLLPGITYLFIAMYNGNNEKANISTVKNRMANNSISTKDHVLLKQELNI